MQTFTHSKIRDMLPYNKSFALNLLEALKLLDSEKEHYNYDPKDHRNYKNYVLDVDFYKSESYKIFLKSPDMRCICGSQISDPYRINHIHDDFYAIVGSTCYKKFREGAYKEIYDLKKIINGSLKCSCGCGKFVRSDIHEKYANMDKVYQIRCLAKKFTKCWTCDKYKKYDCACESHKENISNIYTEENMQTSNIEDKAFVPFGAKENFKQLDDYYEIRPDDLKKGDHYRYTCQKYQSMDRKVAYGIVEEVVGEGKFKTRGYMSDYPPWVVDTNHKYKKFRLYRRKPKDENVSEK